MQTWVDLLRMRRAYAPRAAVLDLGLDAALSVGGADFANIQLTRPDESGLELVAHRGFEPHFLNYFAFVGDDRTACAQAALDRKAVVVPDVVESPIFRDTEALDVLLGAGVRAVKSAPLIDHAGKMHGVISVHYRRPQQPNERRVAHFEALATAIASSIL